MAGLSLPRWLFPVLIISLIGVVVGLNHYLHREQSAVEVPCADLSAGCRADIGGHEIVFGVHGPIRVLKPFELWLKAPGARQIQASFAMKGMDMGFNLYTLRPGPDGVFRVRVTLPVCVSGRHDWFVVLDVDGKKFSAPFVTQP